MQRLHDIVKVRMNTRSKIVLIMFLGLALYAGLMLFRDVGNREQVRLQFHKFALRLVQVILVYRVVGVAEHLERGPDDHVIAERLPHGGAKQTEIALILSARRRCRCRGGAGPGRGS